MAEVAYKKLIMAGPMRWVTLNQDGETTTLAWFVKVRYTVSGAGNVLFARSDVTGDGKVDVFSVFSDDPVLARHLRDNIFDYTVFAGTPGETPAAPIVEAAFDSVDRTPEQIVESMSALDGTTLTLSFARLGAPRAYMRQVNSRVTEVGAFVVPDGFSLRINGQAPVGRPEVGPLAEAPPMGADLQNVWYET